MNRREFLRAAGWSAAAGTLTWIGVDRLAPEPFKQSLVDLFDDSAVNSLPDYVNDFSVRIYDRSFDERYIDFQYAAVEWPDVVRWSGLISESLQQVELRHWPRRIQPLSMISAMIWHESRGNPGAIGLGHDIGLMQVIARESGYEWAVNRPTVQELLIPEINIRTGVGILQERINMYQDFKTGLAAYNGRAWYADLIIGIHDRIEAA